jgi:hypothetical protein
MLNDAIIGYTYSEIVCHTPGLALIRHFPGAVNYAWFVTMRTELHLLKPREVPPPLSYSCTSPPANGLPPGVLSSLSSSAPTFAFSLQMKWHASGAGLPSNSARFPNLNSLCAHPAGTGCHYCRANESVRPTVGSMINEANTP